MSLTDGIPVNQSILVPLVGGCRMSFPELAKLLEDEKRQMSDWEARLAFTADFRSNVQVRTLHPRVRGGNPIPPHLHCPGRNTKEQLR